MLTVTSPTLEEYWNSFPKWISTLVGTFLMILGILEVDSRHSTITFKIIITGIGSKMAAIYGTGFNTYYWYDMITDIPNAYFVEVGIYKYVSSPTYTLGKLYKNKQ